MNIEQMEHQLALLSGKTVTIVQPLFGNISDSYSGLITKLEMPDHTIKFHFQVVQFPFSKVFRIEDVEALKLQDGTISIVYLRGPDHHALQSANT